MGEVYRADDLKLGHAVALKFHSLANDPASLERFHAEVRNARQVSHPNVCRVYDIGDFEGRSFLSMEYVDGEDLASLLRRIGRLPRDKALEIARQLCAGLAAAHDAGLLHRDLKPANIMIDGRGSARITDFGLALRKDDVATAGETAGTPAYMSPEQLLGGEATVRSDIYSLGLVLYELFTGRRPFEADSLADWKRVHLESHPRPPRLWNQEVEPAVERVILRCLEKDPAMRPASVRQVLAGLPGDDPLAAALAAGETPSPEMVAAAGEQSGIQPRTAAVLLVSTLVLLAILVPLARKGTLLGIAPLAKSPDVYAERAQQIAARFGYDAEPADKFLWIRRDREMLRHRAQHVPPPANVRELRTAWPGPYQIVYRQSPEPLATDNATGVTEIHPPPVNPGMVLVVLNNGGHLLRFEAVNPRYESDAGDAATADASIWPAVLEEADLDVGQLKSTGPLRVPPVAFDARAAWEGSKDGLAVRVDAAAFRGKLVFFSITPPWVRPGDTSVTARVRAAQIAGFIFDLMFFVVLPLAVAWMAFRNMRSGRGDLQGARKLAVLVGVCFVVAAIGRQHFPRGGLDVSQFATGAGWTIFLTALSWASYLALEPLVRRSAPHLLISWTRLLGGRFRDPLVARDVLIGMTLAVLLEVVSTARSALPWWFPVRGVVPEWGLDFDSVGQPPRFLSFLLLSVVGAVLVAMLVMFLYAVMRVLLRRPWLVIVLLSLLSVTFAGLNSTNLVVDLPVSLFSIAVWMLILTRYGAVSVATMLLLNELFGAPLDLNFATWYVGRSALVLSLTVSLAALAFHYTLAGRRVFSFDDESALAKTSF
jgi:serine/threonine-protein kinase